MNIILCGYHWTGCRALSILQRLGHRVFVYTYESPSHIPSLVEYCRKLDVPFSTENISRSVLPFQPDVICSIYYRDIIKPHVIDACGGRIFNLHPSLLPDYRGCSSLTWAMIQGEKEVGYTYHYIDSGVDTGRILLQRPMVVEEFDTQETLYTRVMFEAMKDFDNVLSMVVDGERGEEQAGGGMYFRRGCPHDGQIDPSWDSEYTERFIRAMIYPPYPPARFDGEDIYSIEDMPSAMMTV